MSAFSRAAQKSQAPRAGAPAPGPATEAKLPEGTAGKRDKRTTVELIILGVSLITLCLGLGFAVATSLPRGAGDVTASDLAPPQAPTLQ